jgi:hypothetical protein
MKFSSFLHLLVFVLAALNQAEDIKGVNWQRDSNSNIMKKTIL